MNSYVVLKNLVSSDKQDEQLKTFFFKQLIYSSKIEKISSHFRLKPLAMTLHATKNKIQTLHLSPCDPASALAVTFHLVSRTVPPPIHDTSAKLAVLPSL